MHIPCRISSCVRRIPDGVDDERYSFSIVIVVEFEPPVVFARQSDGAVVDLLAVHFMQLQFFARTEVMKAPANNKEIIFLFLFTVFIYYFYYIYRSQKYFLLSFPVILQGGIDFLSTQNV